MLVPEIGLTPQVLRQFAAQFGDLVAVLHSALSAGERYDSFKKIKTGRARVVIGTRSAVFAPVRDLGVIIIDEEQDGAYKSEQSPRYHARDVAKYRAVQADALLVLGSATPSVETYYGAKQGKYPVFRLTERFLGAGLPEVLISDMRGQTRAGRSGVIGADLERELLDTLDRGRQAILFLNRRGNSRVIGCAMCGWVPECPHCSTNMTYHSASGYEELGRILFEKYENHEELPEEAEALCDTIAANMVLITEYENEIADMKGQQKCPSCGAVVKNDMNFCPKCGAWIRKFLRR